ncbi:hypothetical protein ST47_g5235 [Ascochyta rabiei]|uniref:Uncharacterized protein n=2 Tax=Didymella rabiei TaxID=5454 RepID=A0A163ECR4_DIDRA|nr:hypothetical protein ST47_g5235 [Ascochyta rabiei]
MRAENEAEERSAVLRQRSPSPSQKILRWITGPWSETDVDTTDAGSGQKQVDHEQIAQTAARGRWDQGDSRTAFGADACADSGASSKEEELETSKAEKKPWDPPFRRQLPRTELVKKSIGSRLHLGTDTPLARKTGRGMEARGVAVRLFPPDSVPEVEDVKRGSQTSPAPPQTPQEPLHRRPYPTTQLQFHNTKHSVFPHQHHSEPLSARNTPQQQTDAQSLPSPLDGAHHTLQPQRFPQMTLDDASNVAVQCAPKDAAKASSKARERGLPLWQVLLVTMGFIIFVFAFAILISHCLAWFIVYKTEARLGEVRSGLLKGGEMKLCLCGKG